MILSIDTSLCTSVAIVDLDGTVLSEHASENPMGHAEVIGTLLAETLEDVPGVSLSHVVAGMGPGPFTGLRIGIAAARAFALGRDLPVVGVTSHDAAALDEAGDIAIVTDARRREMAISVYRDQTADGVPNRVEGPFLLPRDDVDAALAERGVRRVDIASLSAASLARVAARRIAAGSVDAAAREPLYLRSPDVVQPHAPKRVS